MAPNDELFRRVNLDKATERLARSICNKARSKTRGGSGVQLISEVGLPAAAMLLACVKLNTNEVTHKDAQKASCITPKEFKTLLEQVTRLAFTDDEELSYKDLHATHKTTPYEQSMAPYIVRTEEELARLVNNIPRGSPLFICTTYFWVATSAKTKVKMPQTLDFANKYELPQQSFVNALSALNAECPELKGLIQANVSKSASRPKSPTKSPQKAAALPTLPRTPSKSQTILEEDTPRRTSSRIQASPTKGVLPIPSPAPRFTTRQAPRRELPSKDTPKKTTVATPTTPTTGPSEPGRSQSPRTSRDDEDEADAMEVDEDLVIPETPSKRRKTNHDRSAPSVNPLPKVIFPSIPAPPMPQPQFLPSTPSRPKRNATSSPTRPSSPLKKHVPTLKNHTLLDDGEDGMSFADADEEEQEAFEEPEKEEPPKVKQRFRPVYRDYDLWVRRDPEVQKVLDSLISFRW